MHKLDKVDKSILNILMENCKLSYRQIAKRANVSVGTVMNRIRKLTDAKIIKKYSCILDYDSIGYNLGVLIDVRVSKGRLFEVEKKIAESPFVFAVYDITGDFDVAILARFEDRRQLDDFVKNLQRIEFVERTHTKLILNYIKEEGMKFSFPGQLTLLNGRKGSIG